MSTADDRLARMEERIRNAPSPSRGTTSDLARASLEAFLDDSGMRNSPIDATLTGRLQESVHQPTRERLVELEIKRETEVAALRFQLWARLIDAVRVTAWIFASWLPLQAIDSVLKEQSSDGSALDVANGIGIALSIVLAVTLTVTTLRSRLRQRQVMRMRERVDELERHLLRARREHDGDWRQEMIEELEDLKRVVSEGGGNARATA